MTSPGELRWRKTDESVVLRHCPDHSEQFLFYARIYTTGQGYEFSKTNQLILNLKIPPNASSQRLYYKQQAIRQFAAEVTALLTDQLPASESLTLVPMPPSKDHSHPDYDDRLEQVARVVEARFENVISLPFLYMTESMDSYHSRSDRRDADELYELMQIEQAEANRYQPGSIIALLDDVLTSGAHFSAARRRILEACPNAVVIGIFWAKAVSPEDFADD